MATVEVFPTESPYRADKIRQIFAERLDPEDMVDELAPSFVLTKGYKTYYIPENNGPLKIAPAEGTEALVWPPCSGAAWSELPKNLTKSLKVLDLGHDGLLYGKREKKTKKTKTSTELKREAEEKMWEDQTDCREILKSLPNLELVLYCGYYSQIDYDEVAKDFPNIKFEPIY
jgi:hypothetical protein